MEENLNLPSVKGETFTKGDIGSERDVGITSDGSIVAYIHGAWADNYKERNPVGFGVFWKDNDMDNESMRLKRHIYNQPGRAEIYAAITAIRQAKEKGYKRIVIRTNDNNLIESATKWFVGWQNNGWMKTNGTPVKNKPDFKELIDVMSGMDQVTWEQVDKEINRQFHDMIEVVKLARKGKKAINTPKEADTFVEENCKLKNLKSRLGKEFTKDDIGSEERDVQITSDGSIVAYICGDTNPVCFDVILAGNLQENVAQLLDERKVINKSLSTLNSYKIQAAITAIQQAKKNGYKRIVIRTVVDNLIRAATRWIDDWLENGWETRNGSEVFHKEYYLELIEEMTDMEQVTWEPVYEKIDEDEEDEE